MTEVTQEQIREKTGPCRYCEINPVDYFCSECWFGLCEKCLDDHEWNDTGVCMGDCYDKLPLMGDISIFQKEDAR